MAPIGLLLSGCGAYDGTDVHEAVLAILALGRQKAHIEFLAPAGVQVEAVDHATGQISEGDTRSVLSESARLARGRIVPISEGRASLLGALVVPGGEGVARSLMTGVGEVGRRREVLPDVAALVRRVLDSRKPVGAVSLGGALTSTVLGLPLDEDPFSTPATEIRIDEGRGIVWTPGFLVSSDVAEVAVGIDRMIAELLRRAARSLPVTA